MPGLPDCHRSFGGSPAAPAGGAWWQSGSTIPFPSMSPPPDYRRSSGSSPAAPAGGARRQSGSSGRKGIVLPELSCRTPAEAPPPELGDCNQSFGGGAGGLPPELRRWSWRTATRASAAVRQLPRTPCQAVTWQSDKLEKNLFLYGICLLLKCANISAQRSSAGPQNLSYALIGGGWGSGR